MAKAPTEIRYSVSFVKHIDELLERALELQLEGLIGKRFGSRYEAGKRSGAWIKLKLRLEQEFVIGGILEAGGSILAHSLSGSMKAIDRNISNRTSPLASLLRF